MARKDFDYGDEGMVLAEMARELDIDPDDPLLNIDEDSGLTGFGTGTVYEISHTLSLHDLYLSTQRRRRHG